MTELTRWLLAVSVWLLPVCGGVAQTEQAPLIRSDRLAAIYAYGAAAHTPIGLEIVDWTVLERESSTRWDGREPALAVVRRIVGGGSQLVVAEEDGVILVRSSTRSRNALDTVISDFGSHRANLPMLSWALHESLRQTLDPTPRPGVAGSMGIPPGTPSIGPLNLHDGSVRTILSKIITAAPNGGLWLADGGVQADDSLDAPLWAIVSYNQDSVQALEALDRFRRQRASLRRGMSVPQ